MPPSELGPELVQEVREACEAGAVMTGLALSEALGREITVSIQGTETLDGDRLPADLQGQGVLLVLEAAEASAIVILPAAAIPFLPTWCLDPQEVGTRLETLAKQCRVLVPKNTSIISSWAIHVDDIPAALAVCGLAPNTPRVLLNLKTSQHEATISLAWPFTQVEQLLVADAQGTGADRPTYETIEQGLAQLPPYTRSLLKVRVPVSVTLASTRQSLRRIMELSPGAIISFKKTCDETLTLEIGDQTIADGEAVKVGDKFGLWITAMTLPPERFETVAGQEAQRQRARKHA